MNNTDAVLRLTEKMLEASSLGEWDVVFILQQQREHLVQGTASGARSSMDPNAMLSILRKLQLLNDEITSRARAERQHRKARLEDLRRGRHGTQRYGGEAQNVSRHHDI